MITNEYYIITTSDTHMINMVNYIQLRITITNHIHQPFVHLPTCISSPSPPSLLEKAARVQSLTPTKAWMLVGPKAAEKAGIFTRKK